jgi:hypothetical protein
MGPAHGVSGAPHERTGRRAGQQQHSDNEREHADDGRSSRSEKRAEQLAEALPQRTAVG